VASGHASRRSPNGRRSPPAYNGFAPDAGPLTITAEKNTPKKFSTKIYCILLGVAAPGSPTPFFGRERELETLLRMLARVRRTGRGAMVSMRGRRRVGKSRLAQELIRQEGCPSVFYTPVQGPGPDELQRFLEAIGRSDAPAGADVRRGAAAHSWEAALELAVSGASRRAPVVLVIDELPYLVDKEPTIEAVLQLVWDRTLQHTPVLVLLIGSDRATMQALSDEGRPLYDRVRGMAIEPLHPAAIAAMLDLDPVDAFDAYTVIGGFPVLAAEWERGRTLTEYLRDALSDASSFLAVSAERALAAEFPADLHARAVLSAIGGETRAHKAIQARAGLSQTVLDRTLRTLVAKDVVERSTPYSAAPSPKNAQYAIADPYMRFWLRFVGPNIDLVERGRGELVVQETLAGWPSFRGRSIEPTVRDALERLLPAKRYGDARFLGAYWNRTHTVQVDLVGGDTRPVARRVPFVGSVKWRERNPFDRADTAALIAGRAHVPGAGSNARLVGVSRNGFAPDAGLDVALGAQDLLDAYAGRG
jgi:AAA+ ATPase superfamily predicted ATPase